MKVLAKCCLSLALLYAGSAAAGSNYGAFAYDPTNGNYGGSADYGSPREAAAQALRYCQKQPGSRACKVVGVFANVCGSLAVGDGGAGFSADRDYRRDALSECSHGGSNRNCRIKSTMCNHAYEADNGGGGSRGYSNYPFDNTSVAHREASGCYNSNWQHVSC